ncbi:hypothetical protein AB751O23_AX_00020 [Chlamydiales bacterium SCGC AB-751-O23]|jgi:hypothetical protein|nr:hypothetical protein AB751O23_AX_00020 [Chlamydiales bacterium SCGC AB-751-O23]
MSDTTVPRPASTTASTYQVPNNQIQGRLRHPNLHPMYDQTIRLYQQMLFQRKLIGTTTTD